MSFFFYGKDKTLADFLQIWYRYIRLLYKCKETELRLWWKVKIYDFGKLEAVLWYHFIFVLHQAGVGLASGWQTVAGNISVRRRAAPRHTPTHTHNVPTCPRLGHRRSGGTRASLQCRQEGNRNRQPHAATSQPLRVARAICKYPVALVCNDDAALFCC